MRIAAVLLAGVTALLAPRMALAQEATPVTPAVETGSEVSIEYTLRDDGGAELDSNKGRGPLTYTQGEHQIIPGLEKALSGMRAGDETQVTVPPTEAYGETDPAAVAEVPKDAVPPNALAVGTQLVARSPDGRSRLVRVKEVRDTTVVIDLNHPLAGKILHFEVKVLKVEPPKK